MHVEKKTLNVQHACLENSINLTLTPSFEWMGNIRYFNWEVKGLPVIAWAAPDADREERRGSNREGPLPEKNIL